METQVQSTISINEGKTYRSGETSVGV